MDSYLDTGTVSVPMNNYLFFVGLWFPETTPFYYILYRIYSTIFLLIFSGYYTLCMCVPILMIRDTQDIPYKLYMSLTEFALFFKVLYFLDSNKELQLLFKKVNSFRLESSEEQQIVKKKLKYFIKFAVIYYVTSNSAVTFVNVPAFIGGVWKLPYSGWYPGMDWQDNRRDFLAVSLYQYIGMLVTCNMNLSLDLFFCLMMHMNGAQMEILGKRMQTLGHEQNFEKNGAGRTYKKSLKDFINIHRGIIELSNQIDDGLVFSFFFQLTMSGVTICCITIEMAKV